MWRLWPPLGSGRQVNRRMPRPAAEQRRESLPVRLSLRPFPTELPLIWRNDSNGVHGGTLSSRGGAGKSPHPNTQAARDRDTQNTRPKWYLIARHEHLCSCCQTQQVPQAQQPENCASALAVRKFVNSYQAISACRLRRRDQAVETPGVLPSAHVQIGDRSRSQICRYQCDPPGEVGARDEEAPSRARGPGIGDQSRRRLPGQAPHWGVGQARAPSA